MRTFTNLVATAFVIVAIMVTLALIVDPKPEKPETGEAFVSRVTEKCQEIAPTFVDKCVANSIAHMLAPRIVRQQARERDTFVR